MLITDINIRPSKLLTGLLLGTLCASTICIASLMITPVYKFCILIITLAYGLTILRQHCLLKSKQSITRLILSSTGWQIVTPAQTWQGQLGGDSTLTYPFMVLRFKVEGRKSKISCLICSDSLSPQRYRQLLVLLRTTHAMEAEQIRRKRSVIHSDG
jgi:hypothetical protein